MKLTNEQQKSHENAKVCYICKKKFEETYIKDKEHRKVRDHCHCTSEYRSDAYRLCNLKCNISKENSVVFHNRSNYYYHTIIKEVAEEFEGKFTCF